MKTITIQISISTSNDHYRATQKVESEMREVFHEIMKPRAFGELISTGQHSNETECDSPYKVTIQ